MSLKLMKSTLLLTWIMPAAVGFGANFGQNQQQPRSARVFAFALQAGQCVENGDRCDASSDCCGGICSYQTCVYSDISSSGACSYGGQACSSDGECCSGYCASYGACE